MVEEWRTALQALIPRTMEKSGLHALNRLLRNSLLIVSGLGSSKDQQSIFLNIFERLCEPAYALGWSVQEAAGFYDAVAETWTGLSSVDERYRKRYEASLKRVTGCMKVSMVRFSESWLSSKA